MTMYNERVEFLKEKIEVSSARSAWARGVKELALDLIDNLDNKEMPHKKDLERVLLNGAENWRDYSWGGCAYIYNSDIARLLCSPSELEKTKNGERKPNKKEEWLDTQARALFQACNLIKRFYESAYNLPFFTQYTDKGGTGSMIYFSTIASAIDHTMKEWGALCDNDKKRYANDPAVNLFGVYDNSGNCYYSAI